MLVKRAQEYLERLSAEASTNVALLRELAETYEKLAAIQGDFTNSNVGDVTAALQSYRKSAALLESAAALEPTNQAIQRDCARSYLELARALSQSEMPAENSAYLQRAERILRSLSVTAQNDKQLQYLLAKTYELTAKRLAKDKDLESALSHYRKAAAIYGELHQAQPDDANYLTEVSFSHKHIGAVLAVQKQYAAALEQYQAARAIDEHRIATNPQNLDYRYAVTFDYSDIGYIIGKQGDVDQALEYYRKSLEIRSAMAVEDPDDARTKRGMATVLTSIGNNLVQKKDYAAALEAYQRSRMLSEELVRLAAGNTLLRFDVARTEQRIAQAYADMAFAQSPNGELGYCREASKWNRRAWSTWTPPSPTDANGTKLPVLDDDTDNIGHCSRVMARAASGSGAT
jgi:tetratricopeptide (TPR) repeat protein